MWTLWIISSIIGSAEPKLTRYETFEHKETCYHAWYEVSSEFTEGETAFCEGPDD